MPRDRKALTGIEQTGDRRAKVPLACVERFFLYIAMGINSMLACYYVEKTDEVKVTTCNMATVMMKLYQI